MNKCTHTCTMQFRWCGACLDLYQINLLSNHSAIHEFSCMQVPTFQAADIWAIARHPIH